MSILTLEQLLKLHILVIERYGGSAGVRDLGRLESAVAAQTQEVFGQELYKTVEQKAAVMMRNIIGDHPFVDGNKRTATLAALTLLESNGYRFIAKKGELENFAVKVATDNLDVDQIAEWLKSHSKKV